MIRISYTFINLEVKTIWVREIELAHTLLGQIYFSLDEWKELLTQLRDSNEIYIEATNKNDNT